MATSTPSLPPYPTLDSTARARMQEAERSVAASTDAELVDRPELQKAHHDRAERQGIKIQTKQD